MHRPAGHSPAHRAADAVRGVLALGLGAVALGHPSETGLLIVAFAAFAFLEGLVRIVTAMRAVGRDPAWWLHAAEGAIGIAAGAFVVRVARNLVTLTWTIAEWAFAVGALAIVFSVLAWRRLPLPALWLLAGVVAVAFGGALLWLTLGGLRTPGLVLGGFAIVYGVVALLMAARGGAPAPA